MPLLGYDPEKFLVSIHHKTLNQLALFRRDLSRAVEHVFELAAFENNRGESNLVKQLLVIKSLDDHPDAAGDGRVVSHQVFASARYIVASRRGQRSHVNDHW